MPEPGTNLILGRSVECFDTFTEFDFLSLFFSFAASPTEETAPYFSASCSRGFIVFAGLKHDRAIGRWNAPFILDCALPFPFDRWRDVPVGGPELEPRCKKY